MPATLERLGSHRVALEVTVPREDVEAGLERAYRRLVRSVTIPGFRRGRAPRAIFERFVGRAALWDEALDDLVREAYRKAIDEAGLAPIAEPEVEVRPIPEDETLSFRAEVEVKPEVALGDYRSLRVPLEPAEVTAEDVERVVSDVREAQAELVPVEEERALAPGDFAVVDYILRDEAGKEVAAPAVDGYIFHVGAGEVLPEIDEGVVGMKVDETREIPVAFPADHRVEALRGRRCVAAVTLREIKAKRLPPLDDELARAAGPYATLEEMKEDVRNRLAQAARRRAWREATEKALAQLVEAAAVDVPDVLVERRLPPGPDGDEAGRAAGEGELAAAREAERAELRRRAERQVAEELVLEALAKAEGLEVTDDELRREVERVAQSFGAEDAPRVRRAIARDPVALLRLREDVRLRKAFARLGEIATGEPEPAIPGGREAGAATDGERTA
ncbi:MAG: trigger factor [Clostridia bacterium]|nr:trigger factor [Clostridia bacterium]